MSQRDPLESIMGMLTKGQGVNPNAAAQRKASIGTERLMSGAEPRKTGRPPQQQGVPQQQLQAMGPQQEGTMNQLLQAVQTLQQQRQQAESQLTELLKGGVSEEQKDEKKRVENLINNLDKSINGIRKTVESMQLAAAPVPQGGAPAPMDQATGTMQSLGMEQGTGSGMSTPPDAMHIVLDALNESILALKVQLKQEQSPDKKQEIQKHIARLRNEVIEMGGTPVEQEETVEQGLQKLTGHGYVGSEAIQELAGQSLKDVGSALGINISSMDGKALVGGQAYDYGAIPGTEFNVTEGRHYVSDPDAFLKQFGNVSSTAKVTHQPGYYTEGMQATQGQDDFSQILQMLGGGHQASKPPAMMLTPDYVNNLIQQYGLTPRSQGEIEAHAKAIVERQAWDRTHLVQRELDRFERDHPPEYARAQEKVNAQADQVSADMQEEFSNRGMYYSSVMANRLGAVDAAAMDIVGQIASEAASYVLGLRDEIRDIAQWAVLEEQVIKFQLEEQERANSQVLLQIQSQVAMHADQMALDSWYRQESLALEQRDQGLRELQFKSQEAERAGMHMANAFMADSPLVQQELRRMGMTPEQFQQLPLEQRSHMVSGMMQYVQFDQQVRTNELNMQAVSLDMVLAQRQMDHMIEFDWAQEDRMWTQLKHSMAVDWAGIDLQRQSLAMRGASGSADDMDMYIDEEGYRIYDEGLQFVESGNLAAARGSLARLQELGLQDWALKLGKEMVRDIRKPESEEPNMWERLMIPGKFQGRPTPISRETTSTPYPGHPSAPGIR